MHIRAYAINERGGVAEPFAYERVLRSHDVLVKITHCSVARGDVQFIDNDWGDARFPLVPGHEIVGLVEETGPDVADLRPDDRVGIGYQQEACFECEFCIGGTEQFCRKQKVIAVDTFGGLAEHIVVDSRFAFRLPPSLPSAASTPLLSSGLTVYAGMAHAALPNGARVGVLGIGGLGRLALQFLRAMGHTVAGFSRSPEKREMVERLGVEYIDSSAASHLTTYHGTFDLILSTLNVQFDLDSFLKLLKPEGRLCLVASPLQPVPMSPGLLYDYARRSIFGSYIGSRSDTRQMLAFAASHGIEPTVEVMPFARVNDAIARVRRGEGAGRLVLENHS